MRNSNEINTEQIKSISILNNNKVKKIMINNKLWWSLPQPEKLEDYFNYSYFPTSTGASDGKEPMQFGAQEKLFWQKSGFSNPLFEKGIIYIYYQNDKQEEILITDLYEKYTTTLDYICKLTCDGQGTIEITNQNNSGLIKSINFMLKREDTGEILTTSIGMYYNYENDNGNTSPDDPDTEEEKSCLEQGGTRHNFGTDGVCIDCGWVMGGEN